MSAPYYRTFMTSLGGQVRDVRSRLWGGGNRAPLTRHNPAAGILAALAFVLLVGSSAPFTVSQIEQALVVRLGQPIRTITEPGLHFKFPLFDSVIRIDNRIIDLENPQQELITSDQRRLVVDAFARYRVTDALKFYQTIGTIDEANSRLSILLNSTMRAVLGGASAIDTVRDNRSALMTLVREQLENEARFFGISVVDVRIRRANLPTQNSQAVYQLMRSERQRQATAFRAQGGQRSLEIRAKADRDVTILIADATSAGEQIRGEGDRVRNQIYAAAYGRDPEFFAFYRTMRAYEAAFPSDTTRMLLTPDSDFFRYFRDPMGGASRPTEPR
jgi:membrane protease subunit HflC